MNNLDQKYFKRGVNVDTPRRFSPEFVCAAVFYLSVLVHFVLCMVIFANKNAEVMTVECTDVHRSSPEFTGVHEVCTGVCPDGYIKCTGVNMCVTPDLCKDVINCQDNNLGRRMESTDKNDGPADVWEFFEKYWYQPTVLFVCVLILAGFWIVGLCLFPRQVVWGTIAADVALLSFVFLFFLVHFDVVLVPCVIIAALLLIASGVAYKKINMACEMMKVALQGLFSNKRAVFVCFGAYLVWLAFVVLWVAGVIGLHLSRDVGESGGRKCELVNRFGSGVMAYFMLHYYWFSFFLLNIITIMTTVSVSGWYFKEDRHKHFWKYALKWSLGPLAGGNAISAALMGILEYLMSKVGTMWDLIFALVNPMEWILICIALGAKTIAMTYTKFGVIAMAYSGRPFCECSHKGFELLKQYLGLAVVCDFVGSRVMSWVTFVLSLAVAISMWAWADDVQHGKTVISELEPFLLVLVMILQAWLISHPFLTVVLIVFITQVSEGTPWLRVANSFFASLFVGSITFCVLTFVSHVVVVATNAALFCYAVELDRAEAQKDRFNEFYKNVAGTFAVGTVSGGQGVVIGQAPPDQPVVETCVDPAVAVVPVAGVPVAGDVSASEIGKHC